MTRHQQEFPGSRPIGHFPSPVATMAGAAALGLCRELRTRPVRNRPRTSRRGQAEHKPVATSLASARPPRLAHSPCATSCRNCRPSPCTRLSRARSTTTAPPHPRLRQASRLSASRRPGMGGRHGTHADGSHVHCHPINGLGTRLCPCGIATATPQTFTVASRPRRNRPSLKFPARHEGRVRAANQPESTGFRAGIRSRGVTQPISHVYLPVSLTAPAPSGSPGTTRLCRGCSRPPRRPADQAASCFTPPLRRQGDRGLPPPFGPNSASWRTFLAYTFPSRSPRPAHPAVLNRRDFVEAAPALTTDPWLSAR